MRKVTHQRVQEPLSGTALLPCVFTLRPSPSHEPPRIKWTKLWGQRGPDGLQKQQSILVAKDNIIKVKKAFQGRVTLPGYPENRYNASLVLTGLRSSDSGMYRCEVVVGINDEQDTVPLQVTGVVFHYRAPHDRYALSFSDARRVCLENSASIATPAQLQATFDDGYDNCDAGWLSDQTVRYPIQSPRPGCFGDKEDSPGVRNYGSREPDEMFDVYCFADSLQGEVFHTSVPEKLSLASASTHCHTLGAQLATVGQLYLAWQGGLDRCDPGWLADGSVRYPINLPRRNCGGDEPGVRTVYHNPNRTGFPDTSDLFDAYCYQEKDFEELAAILHKTLENPALNSSSEEEVQLQRNGAFPEPSTWTGLVDLEKEDFKSIINNESSEISEEHVVIHLGPEERSVDWEDDPNDTKQENLQGGSAKEETDDSDGPDGPNVSPDPSSTTPSSSTQAQTSNSVISNFVNTIMKPFRYWTGTGEPEIPATEPSIYKGTSEMVPPTRMKPSKGKTSKGGADNAIVEPNIKEHSYNPSSSDPEEELLEQEREVVLVAAEQEIKRAIESGTADPTPSASKSFGSIRSSQQIWPLKSLKVAPGNNRHLITQTSTPMEAKQASLEIITIPVSRNNPENFSGEGKDLNEDGYLIPKGPPSALSAEDGKDGEGSGGKELPFTLDSQMNGSDEHGVPPETTVRWQLMSLRTTQQPTSASGSSEPSHEKPTETVEEARGEIVYVHRPIENHKNSPSNKVNVPFVKRKQDLGLTVEVETHTPTTPSPVSVPFVKLKQDLGLSVESEAHASNTPTTPSPVDPTEDKLTIQPPTLETTPSQPGEETTTEDILCTPDPAVSSTWLPVVQEEVDTPQPPVPTIITTQAGPTDQPTSPDLKDTSQQAESRAGVSESFVLTQGWITSEPSSQTTGSPEESTTAAGMEISPSRTSGKRSLVVFC
ncbi:Neurocan core protein [Labeo rohita]|uniref:Neurocan core protein n=1 Tax=Labeo rohita TaxID=84645 RepID=A0ABQ8LIA8_LABRO|nr:Neurocan core protein [Labeo rohita]